MATACFIFILTNKYTEGSTTDPVASPLLTDFKPFKRIVSKDECKLPIVQLTACTCVLYLTRVSTQNGHQSLILLDQRYIFIQSTLCSITGNSAQRLWRNECHP